MSNFKEKISYMSKRVYNHKGHVIIVGQHISGFWVATCSDFEHESSSGNTPDIAAGWLALRIDNLIEKAS